MSKYDQTPRKTGPQGSAASRARRSFFAALAGVAVSVPAGAALADARGTGPSASALAVRRIIDGVNAGKPETLVNALDADTTWRIHAAPSEGGNARLKGREKIARHFSEWSGRYRVERFEVHEMVAEGEHVVCFCTETLIAVRDGKREQHALVQHWRMRNGTVLGMEEYVLPLA